METCSDGTGYNTYGTGNQYPEVGYWILRGDLENWCNLRISSREVVFKYFCPEWDARLSIHASEKYVTLAIEPCFRD
jgi:hypothetical protein